MITAVDTNVLLDVFGADPNFGPRAKDAVRRCLAEGGLVACEVVWVEVAGFFSGAQAAKEAMHRVQVDFSAIDLDTALAASAAWRQYRTRGGGRQRVAADFLIGSHALTQANRLLTRDRGFYRKYFSKLRILDPARL